jgi:hypothetical protein
MTIPDLPLHFDRPWLVLGAAVVGGVLSALVTWVGAPGWARRRRILAIAAATLLGTCLGGALAGPHRSVERSLPLRRVLILDASSSHRPAERAAARDLLAEAPEDLLLYDGRGLRLPPPDTPPAELLAAASVAGPAPSPDRVALAALGLDTTAADLQALWVTDGRDPPPDRELAWRWRRPGRRIDVRLTGRPLADARPERLEAPEVVRAGTPFDVQVTVSHRGVETAPYELRVLGAAPPHAAVRPAERVELTPGAPHRFAPVTLPPGAYRLEVAHVGEDAVPANDMLRRHLRVLAPPRVLLVHGTPVPYQDDVLRQAFAGQGYEVTRVTPGEPLPPPRAELIVIAHRDPGGLPGPWLEQLAATVTERGAGLLLVTGREDASPWPATSLGPLLPVDLHPPPPPEPEPAEPGAGEDEPAPDPDAEAERAIGEIGRLALVLCIDRSGSMEGDKLRFAKQSVVESIGAVDPEDHLAIIAFDARAQLLLELTPAGDASEITRAVARLAPGGSTNIPRALDVAHSVLRPHLDEYAVKHVVLLTDGHSQTLGDPKGRVERMVRDGITVSTIGIGDNFDEKLLTRISLWGHGRVEAVRDFQRLPYFIHREVARVARLVDHPPLEEEEPAPDDHPPVVEPPPDGEVTPGAGQEQALLPVHVAQRLAFLAGIEEPLPPVGGVVPAQARPWAQTVLTAGSGEPPAPLAVAGVAGAGRIVAWLTDLGGPWSEPWVRWGELPRFLGQLGRFLVPLGPPGAPTLEAEITEDRHGHVRIHAQVLDSTGEPLQPPPILRGTAQLSDRTLPIPFRAGLRDGTWTGELTRPAGSTAPVELQLRALTLAGEPLAATTRYTGSATLGELEDLEVHREAWRAWVQAAGGRLVPPSGGILPATRVEERVDLLPWVILAALTVLPILALLRRS